VARLPVLARQPTLSRLKQQGILKPERHWARKNPGRRCSDLLWHIHRCQLTLGRI
jgi:hypothetical protein